MKTEAVVLCLCFFAVLTAGLTGCARADGATGAEKMETNYPDVWERVLPEEMQTNIANYGAGLLYPVEKEHTDLLDYAVSVSWKIDEVYHIDGEDHDDVIFRFSDSDAGINKNYNVLYYSFFGDRLLNKNGKYEFPPGSSVHDMISAGNVPHKLLFIDKAEAKRKRRLASNTDANQQDYLPRITLSNGVIYDENIENYKYRGNTPELIPYYHSEVGCHDPPYWGGESLPLEHSWTSHKHGAQFLPVGYMEKDVAREDSWILLQGLSEPRYVSKYCELFNASIGPVKVYGYYEHSFVRAYDDVIPLQDGTFLFVGTRNSFPAFHIIRMEPDMSIPAELSSRYRWVRYKDYVGILALAERGELFSGRNKTCSVLYASHPHCVKAGKDGYCSEMKGWYLEYNRRSLDSFISRTASLERHPFFDTSPCLNLALRDYVRDEFEIYHCGEGDEAIASVTPCGERDKQ